MKTIELIAQKCAEDIAEIDGLCIAACPGSSDLTAKAVQPDHITPIIAAAMREVCEPLRQTCVETGDLVVKHGHTIDQLRADLAVADGELNEIKECAESIVRNMNKDIDPALRDNMWVITASCHAKVILQALARIAEARKGQP